MRRTLLLPTNKSLNVLRRLWRGINDDTKAFVFLKTLFYLIQHGNGKLAPDCRGASNMPCHFSPLFWRNSRRLATYRRRNPGGQTVGSGNLLNSLSLAFLCRFTGPESPTFLHGLSCLFDWFLYDAGVSGHLLTLKVLGIPENPT